MNSYHLSNDEWHQGGWYQVSPHIGYIYLVTCKYITQNGPAHTVQQNRAYNALSLKTGLLKWSCAQKWRVQLLISAHFIFFSHFFLLKSHFVIQVLFGCYLNAKNSTIFLYLLFSDPWECYEVHLYSDFKQHILYFFSKVQTIFAS